MPVFRGTRGFYDYEASDQLAQNLKEWFSYGLLELGAFTNISLSSSYSVLQNTSSGIYEGLNQWVWETGVIPISGLTPPHQVSGVYVNNKFFPLGTSLPGGATYNVDYRNGRILTSKNLPKGSGLKCEYSVRNVAIYLADSPQWRTIVDSFLQNYSTLGDLAPSGFAQQLKENRLWMPCMIIDVKDGENLPFQLGGLGELGKYQVQYHIFSDTPFANKRLLDMVVNQNHLNLNLFDINKAPFALNYDGTLTGSGMPYPSLAAKNGPYFWTYAWIDETAGSPLLTQPYIWRSEVRSTIQLERYTSTF